MKMTDYKAYTLVYIYGGRFEWIPKIGLMESELPKNTLCVVEVLHGTYNPYKVARTTLGLESSDPCLFIMRNYCSQNLKSTVK